ncbi:hypothetical protein J2X11_001056 [Aeromicrobium panaciterrae]|uniref:Secreted protein n=1 Tax=Aeromicrobium panaciterrae TaxID=363861 RepID=A0ABU1UM10_9ACTN|nr:DUF5719 family protein [Aeromicrobium panaciterrae]MDR7086217.1 hypothetical protein [Aeromicrobium panaciterrae]
MIRYRTVGIPLVAAGLVIGAYFAPEQSDDPRPPAGVKVTQTTYGCPAGAGITVAAGQVSPGTTGTATVLPGKSTAKDLGGTRSWRTARVDGRGVLVEQQGRGSGPSGFFGSIAPKAGGSGLGVGSCSASVDAAWFLGLGSGVKHFSTVTLTNGTTAPAAVDLDLWGPDGKIDAVGAKGIVIKPHTTRRVQLEDLAAGEPELALRVLRRRGAVSAVVNDFSTAVFGGTEPVTATSAPRRSQVVGGLVSGASGRTLALLNPGTATARVEVDVIGSKSTFKPEGLGAIKVKGESVRLVEVPSTAGGARQALKVTSDVPVAATVRMAPNELDYAYAESVLPLSGPAIVPVSLGKGVSAPDLIVTAPRGTSSVQVFAYDKNMKQLGEFTMSIEGETTKHIDVAKKFTQKGIAYLVVQSKGEVVGAATYRDGGLVSSLALLSAPIRVLAPQVRPID